MQKIQREQFLVFGAPLIEDAARCKMLALHGMSRDAWKRFSDAGYKHYQVVECGFKYNMMDLQAATGIHQLERVERCSKLERRENNRHIVMNTEAKTLAILISTLTSTVAWAQAPVINSFNKNGQLTWAYGYDANTNTITRLETTPDLANGSWAPFYYDLVSTNLNLPPWSPVYYTLPTNATRTVTVPANQAPSAFYRIAAQSGIPDPSLVLHLTFQNDLASGVVLDSSGYGNHGFRYEPTRWPSQTIGPDGKAAAEFHIYTDGFGDYGRSGDYVVVQHTPELNNLSNATIMAWAHFYPYSPADLSKPLDSTLISADWYDTDGSWSLGRLNTDYTLFVLQHPDPDGTGHDIKVLSFPDQAPTGDTGGWHYYGVTWDGTTLRSFFDGTNVAAVQVPWLTNLVLGGTYIGIGCWNFDQTPMLYDSGLHPNNGWITGAVGDMRIYNRALSANEILGVYNTFDRQPPSTNAPGLIMQLDFNNWPGATDVTDTSGNGNNALVFGTAANKPTLGVGPDGSPAAHFVTTSQGHNDVPYAGNYLAVTNLNGMDRLTNGTIMVWAWYDTNSDSEVALIDGGYETLETNSFRLWRDFWPNTLLSIYDSTGTKHDLVGFPDYTTTNATTGWHHYAVTWDTSTVTSYFDGTNVMSAAQVVPFLRVGSQFHWLAIGCWHHEGTPQYDLPEQYPNCGWFSGYMDDVRIYNRTLSASEISAVYKQVRP